MIQSKIIIGETPEKRQETAEDIIIKCLNIPTFKPHPDFLFIEGENSIKIEQVKELIGFLMLKPYSAPNKIILIKEADKLTIPAQNALLKTLEEPPANSIIILTAPKTESLLATIVSRCQIIRLTKKEKIRSIDLTTVAKARVGERLKMASLYAGNKNQAQDFIKMLITSLRETLIREPSFNNLYNLRLAQSAATCLYKANVNPQLLVGNLLINLVKNR